jgi:hypothetical protein
MVSVMPYFPAGAEVFALLGFCLLHLAVGVEFGPGVGVPAGSRPCGVRELTRGTAAAPCRAADDALGPGSARP